MVNTPASQAQCEARPENYYVPSGDPYFVSEKVVPSELSLNMFKYLELLRAEFWYAATMNTTITRADDPGCVYVGTGISLEDIKYLDPTWEIPILTNVRIIGQKIFIPGKTNTFVTKEQFKRLVGILGLQSTVVLNKNPRVMVTISKIFGLMKNEEQLRSHLTELNLQMRNYQTKTDYIIVKHQRLHGLETMMKRSVLADKLELLERAAFHRNVCNLQSC